MSTQDALQAIANGLSMYVKGLDPVASPLVQRHMNEAMQEIQDAFTGLKGDAAQEKMEKEKAVKDAETWMKMGQNMVAIINKWTNTPNNTSDEKAALLNCVSELREHGLL